MKRSFRCLDLTDLDEVEGFTFDVVSQPPLKKSCSSFSAGHGEACEGRREVESAEQREDSDSYDEDRCDSDEAEFSGPLYSFLHDVYVADEEESAGCEPSSPWPTPASASSLSSSSPPQLSRQKTSLVCLKHLASSSSSSSFASYYSAASDRDDAADSADSTDFADGATFV